MFCPKFMVERDDAEDAMLLLHDPAAGES